MASPATDSTKAAPTTDAKGLDADVAEPDLTKPTADEKGLDDDAATKLDLKRVVDIVFVDHTGKNADRVVRIPIGFATAESTHIFNIYEQLVTENEDRVSKGLPEKPYTITLVTSYPHGIQWNILEAIETYWRIHAGQHPRVHAEHHGWNV
jgi:hypothetical protein